MFSVPIGVPRTRPARTRPARLVAPLVIGGLVVAGLVSAPTVAFADTDGYLGSIDGAPSVGTLLTATTDFPVGDTLSYDWTNITDGSELATSATYTPTVSDFGDDLQVVVTDASLPDPGVAQNADAPTFAFVTGATTITGAGTSVLPGDGGWITGTPRVGETVIAEPGPWWFPDGLAFHWAWFRNGAPIAGVGDTAFYTLAPDDFGAVVTVVMTGAKDGFSPATETLRVGGAAGILPASFAVPTQAVRLSGTPLVGQRLVPVTTGLPTGTTVKYTWMRDGVATTLTGTGYTTGLADAGHSISVRETVSKVGYDDVVLTSPRVAVTGAWTTAAAPTISGSPDSGSTLKATPGALAPAATAVAYQWLRDGVAISNGKAATYTLWSADLGHRITVKTTATRLGYPAVVRVSAVTTIHLLLTPKTPTVTGTAAVGGKLVGTAPSWGSGVRLTYRWLRQGVAVSGATSLAYTVSKADKGKTLALVVTGSKSGYTTRAVSSRTIAIK